MSVEPLISVEEPEPGDLTRLLDHYHLMVRIRAFEEKALAALGDGLANGAVHLSIGQEAIPTGVCGHLRRNDILLSTHRGHGHTLAKGADSTAMLAELLGRTTGTCQGKGGSMHIADFNVGMLGANGVVAANIPIAVGAAHAIKMEGTDRVVACFFGDGAANRGPFMEGLNWAGVYHLPILFVCEDNTYSAMTRTDAMTAGPGPGARAEAMGIPAVLVDGNDVQAVAEEAGRLIAEIRNGGGPRFLHTKTYRLRGHTATDPASYRPATEVEERSAFDPLRLCETRLRQLGLGDDEISGRHQAAYDEIELAYEKAKSAPFPDPYAAYEDVQDIGAPSPRRQ